MTLKTCTSHAVTYICTILIMAGTVKADLFSIQPRLEVGVMSYSFESEEISETIVSEPVALNNGANYTQEAFEYNGHLKCVGIGGTFFLKRFFLDLSGQYAFDGEDSETADYSGYVITSYDEDNQYMNSGYLAAEPEHEASFDRGEIAVSLGYALGSQSSVFIGYKWAKTQFDTTYQGPYSAVYYNSDGDIDGTAGGRVWGDIEFSFEYDGPFIGAIQGWEFRPCRFIQGVFTSSLALAYLRGRVTLDKRNGYVSVTWKDDREVPEVVRPVSGGGVSNRYDTEGDSLGLTLGIAWRGKTFVDDLSYNIGITGYRYEFDAQDNGQSDINETSVVYKFGVAYVF